MHNSFAFFKKLVTIMKFVNFEFAKYRTTNFCDSAEKALIMVMDSENSVLQQASQHPQADSSVYNRPGFEL